MGKPKKILLVLKTSSFHSAFFKKKIIANTVYKEPVNPLDDINKLVADHSFITLINKIKDLISKHGFNYPHLNKEYRYLSTRLNLVNPKNLEIIEKIAKATEKINEPIFNEIYEYSKKPFFTSPSETPDKETKNQEIKITLTDLGDERFYQQVLPKIRELNKTEEVQKSLFTALDHLSETVAKHLSEKNTNQHSTSEEQQNARHTPPLRPPGR